MDGFAPGPCAELLRFLACSRRRRDLMFSWRWHPGSRCCCSLHVYTYIYIHIQTDALPASRSTAQLCPLLLKRDAVSNAAQAHAVRSETRVLAAKRCVKDTAVTACSTIVLYIYIYTKDELRKHYKVSCGLWPRHLGFNQPIYIYIFAFLCTSCQGWCLYIYTHIYIFIYIYICM